MKKYQIIYADPPWEYKAGRCLTPESLLSGENKTPYSYMGIKEICNLGIDLRPHLDENALLFLWVTSPKLDMILQERVGESWGFDYSTVGFVWEKELVNPGYYTLSSVELCLVYRRGNIPQPRGARNVRQFLQERKTRHSQKPDEIRNRIATMFPTQNKLELFARRKVEGWDCWGNEVESDIDFIKEASK